MNVRKGSTFTGLKQLVEYSAPEMWLCGQPGVAGGEARERLSCQGLPARYAEVMEWHGMEAAASGPRGSAAPGMQTAAAGGRRQIRMRIPTADGRATAAVVQCGNASGRGKCQHPAWELVDGEAHQQENSSGFYRTGDG